jgi:hypothetical protein
MKSTGTTSWKWGNKRYKGELIPSRETSTHRYARTHNGNIKSLPKKNRSRSPIRYRSRSPSKVPQRVINSMKKEKLSGCNKPKKTPKHKTKSHVVMACEKGKYKLIRFGQQGVKGAGKNPKSEKQKSRRRSYYARHNAQGKPTTKLSAKYWSHKVKW